MVLANRRLIQVVPRLLPARCGVSDHAIALASELRESYEIDSAFVVLDSHEQSDVSDSVVYCAPERLLYACDSPSGNRPATILVHLSGYGYSADSAPNLLADALENLKAHSRFCIAVFFHELFASGMPWISAFWHAWRQKRTIARIVAVCDLTVTSIQAYVD